jgi:recombinational DNA repair ATPase RecF
MDKGFTLQLSRLPNIEFVNKDTREIEVRQLDDLIAEYDQDRREDARARKSEQRLARRATR